MKTINKDTLQKIKARYSHLDFMKYTWQDSTEMQVGLHTREMCRLIDKAIEDYRNGLSTFLVVKMPFRHGKSQILSRFLPPHFLGEFPNSEVMIVSYAASLSESFSKFARRIMKSSEYKELYPSVSIDRNNGGVQEWGIQDHIGACRASGLTSGITGKGYHLGLLDDYCANRKDAESEVMRASAWESFTNDFLTRRAPVSITIVLATPWHVDDIIGRIEQKIDPNSDKFDKDFPPFKVVSFPATNGEVEIGEDNTTYCDTKKISYEYLFPERFTQEWYAQQYASLGEYASSGLLDCNPRKRGGNTFKMDSIKYHDSLSEFPNIPYMRFWDLAHTEKQLQKDDPDYTSGTLLGFRKVNNLWEMWIKDVSRIQAKAPQRDEYMRATANKDGNVRIGIESSLDAKDTVNAFQNIFRGQRIVKGIKIREDKVTRGTFIEPIFEAGNVHILRANWNKDWLDELSQFPSGKHDDQVDNLTAGFIEICNNSGSISSIGVQGV